MACNHVFAHWQTEEEKKGIVETLNYLKGIGDMQGWFLHFVRLVDPCPTRTIPVPVVEMPEEIIKALPVITLKKENDG